jgi:peptidoglycan/LPS O-acetylase OafA/YrhL
MLRGIAALLVVLFHTQSAFGLRGAMNAFFGVFRAGYRGVDLFFVLSGFIIAHVHAPDIGRPDRLGNYLFNRCARIYPAVWILTLCAGFAYAAGFGGADKTGKLGSWSIIASAFLLPQIGAPLVNVTWTLKYEMFFYFVFSFLIIEPWLGVTLLALWQLSVLSVALVPPPGGLGVGGYYLRALCLEFGVGLACAWLLGKRRHSGVTGHAPFQWAILLAGISAFTGGMAAEGHPVSGFLCAIGSGATIAGLILLEQSGRIAVPKACVMLGGASYSIYLVNFSVVTVLSIVLTTRGRVIPRNDLVFIAVAVVAVMAGVAFDRAVDQPVQRLLKLRLKPALLGSASKRSAKLTG